MAELKYGKYITKVEIRGGRHGQEIIYLGKDVGNANFSLYWYGIAEPFFMKEPPHAHDHDQFVLHFGGDPTDVGNFGAIFEASLGAEGEPQIIDSTCIYHVPKGFIHRGVNIARVDKPISLLNIFLTNEYEKSATYEDEEQKKAEKGKAELKYSEYIKILPVQQGRHGQEIIYLGKDAGGASFSVFWYGIVEPFLMEEPPHAHAHDQLALFFGGDPTDIGDFGAEIEVCLGEEGETHVIDSTSILYIPKWLIHRGINFKRVDKPISFFNIFLAPEYEKSATYDK